MALTDKLTAIADAIRAKTGGTSSLTLDEMPTEIASIQAGGSGGAKITTGTIVPLDKTMEIVHGLGVIPDYFIFYIEETRAETSSTNVTSYSEQETTIETPPTSSGYCQSLFGALRVRDRHFARTTFNGSSKTNWGYYTICDVDKPVISDMLMKIDKNRLYQSSGYTITPFSVDGAFTIRWFAVAGVAE